MMQIFSDMASFETIVLYPEKYPNWLQIFSEHSELFLNISSENYDIERLGDSVISAYIQINTGREPLPLDYHFQSIEDNPSVLLENPRGVYFLNISKESAKQRSEDYGVLVQTVETIDDGVLSSTFYRNLPVNKVFNSDGKEGWHNLLDIQLPPINTMIISDNYLFANENGIRGFNNFLQLIESFLPKNLKIDFHLLLIAQEHRNKDKAWCNKICGDIKTAIRNLAKPYNVVFELVFTETIHNRIALSNYFNIKLDKGFAVFKTHSLNTVHEDNEVYIEGLFHRISKSEGDTEYEKANDSLRKLKKLNISVASYIVNRPDDTNFRILGDCNQDKSLKNRLINDV